MRIFNKKAFSVIEYVLLFIIVLSAFLVMKNHIQRGIFGSWGQSGQSLAFGRQYDPQRTIECSFDEQSNLWYDRNCLASLSTTGQCNGNAVCEEGIITTSCQTSSCDQVNNQVTQ